MRPKRRNPKNDLRLARCEDVHECAETRVVLVPGDWCVLDTRTGDRYAIHSVVAQTFKVQGFGG